MHRAGNQLLACACRRESFLKQELGGFLLLSVPLSAAGREQPPPTDVPKAWGNQASRVWFRAAKVAVVQKEGPEVL